jgi:hypothetical protein
MGMIVTVFALTAAWHALAAWHFTLFPDRTLRRTTNERPPSVIAVELFRFLGGLNAALAALAILAIVLPGARVAAALVLAIANGSQALQDLRVRRLGLARGRFFAQILVGDALFALAALAVVARAAAG